MPVIYRPSLKQLKDQLETQTEEILIDRLRRDLLAGEQFDKPVLTPHHYRSSDEFVPTRKLKNSTGSVSPDGIAPDFDALLADIPDKFATSEQPKLKFLFTIQFFTRDDIYLLENGSQDMGTMAFALKKATRPNPSVNYQDMNFYNYRTKIATKLDYGTATVSFYDDTSNRAHDIFVSYLNAISPASNIKKEEADNLAQTDPVTGLAVGSSIGRIYNANGPFAAIRVTHHTLNPDRYKAENIYNLDANDTKSYPIKIHYDYINPKIINFSLDELDMSQSDINSVELTFVYDTVNIVYENPFEKSVNPTVNVGPLEKVSDTNAKDIIAGLTHKVKNGV